MIPMKLKTWSTVSLGQGNIELAWTAYLSFKGPSMGRVYGANHQAVVRPHELRTIAFDLFHA